MSEYIQVHADEYADLLARARQSRQSEPKGNVWFTALLWGVVLLIATLAGLSLTSAMGWYTPPTWRAQTAQEQPTAAIATPRPYPTPAPVLAAPVQPVYVAQPVNAPPPAVVIPPPAPVAPDQPTAAPPQVVYIQSQGGSTVATGSGTNDAQGGRSTGVCALRAGARRCGK